MSRSYDSNSVSEMSHQFENMQFLEDIDPSLEGGFEIVYDREVPLELRTNTNNEASQQEVGSLESIKVKILVLPGQTQDGSKKAYQTIKIEFTSETDLFFYYVSLIEEETFMETKKEQGIKIEFADYLSWLIKLFNQCYKEPHKQQLIWKDGVHTPVLSITIDSTAESMVFFGVFHMQSEGIARLDFIENMEYKFLEIITLDFIANPEELVKQNVIYRYNILKAKMVFVQGRLEDISSLIKLKNPSLLLQIQRNSLGGSGASQYDPNSSSILRPSNNGSKYNPNNSRMFK